MSRTNANTKKYNMSKAPEDLSNLIWEQVFTSKKLSPTILKSLSQTNKNLNKYLNERLPIYNHKHVKGFCKIHDIGNIIPIVGHSIFSFERLSSIIQYISDKNVKSTETSFKKLFPVFSTKPSTTCLNNTFIIYQLIKYCIVMMRNTSELVDWIDDALFQLFENVYSLYKLSSSSPSPSSSSSSYRRTSVTLVTPVRGDDIPEFSSNNLEYKWHLIGFNLYYVYEIMRMYQDNIRVTITKYKQFEKYIFSSHTKILLNSIAFIEQQFYYLTRWNENNIIIYIFSFMMLRISKDKHIKKEDNIKLIYEDEDETYKTYSTVQNLVTKFKDHLHKTNSNVAKKMVDILQ